MAMLVITKWYPIFKASTVSFILPQPSSEGSGGQENDALWQKHPSSALKKMPKLDKNWTHVCSSMFGDYCAIQVNFPHGLYSV